MNKDLENITYSTRAIDTKYSSGLRFPYMIPEWLPRLANGQTIDYINNQMRPLVSAVATARYMEWESMDLPYEIDDVDSQRRRNSYYASNLQVVDKADALFMAGKPEAYEKTEKTFGSIEDRLLYTQGLTRMISSILNEPRWEDFRMAALLGYNAPHTNNEEHLDLPKKLIVHGRPKSNFSIWAKLQNHHVNEDEIFDTAGIQVLVEDDNHAREIRQQLLRYSGLHPEKFTLMEPYRFTRQEERTQYGLPLDHNPDKDYLDKPKNKYRAIRMNFVDTVTNNIFEVQITPIDVYYPPETYRTQMAQKGWFPPSYTQ